MYEHYNGKKYSKRNEEQFKEEYTKKMHSYTQWNENNIINKVTFDGNGNDDKNK